MTPAIINAVRCKTLKEVDELIDLFNNTGIYLEIPPKMFVNKIVEKKIIKRASSYSIPLTYKSIECEVKE